jgi:hypothetical protein
VVQVQMEELEQMAVIQLLQEKTLPLTQVEL